MSVKVDRRAQVVEDLDIADGALTHAQENVKGDMKQKIQAIRDAIFAIYKEVHSAE